jgi:flagellar protein FlbT
MKDPPGRMIEVTPHVVNAIRQAERDTMSNLVLELRQGEVMIVNGAPIRFRTRSRIELTAKARFLFGKQIMPPDQATSPARRIYFALQSAYIGTETEREGGLDSARHFIAEFQAATTSNLIRMILDQALISAEEDDCYQALKLVRRIIQHEDAMLGRCADITIPIGNPDRHAEYDASLPGL